MSKEFLSIFSLLNIISSIVSQDFCDESYKNVLINTVFNYKDTVYAYRAPDSLWIMKYDYGFQIWRQIGNKQNLDQLFVGLKNRQSFDSPIPISSYAKCERSEPYCRNTNYNFDPTNITFVFDDNQYLIFRHKNDTKYSLVGSKDNQIPWGANRVDQQSVQSIFSEIRARIDSGVFVPSKPNLWKDLVAVLTIDTVYEYEITDEKLPAYVSKTTLNVSPAKRLKGNGGIYHKSQILFFIGNNVWHYTPGSPELKDLGQTYWQFFNCDQGLPENNVTTEEMPSSEAEPKEPEYKTTDSKTESELSETTEEMSSLTAVNHMVPIESIIPETESDSSSQSLTSSVESMETSEQLPQKFDPNTQSVVEIRQVIKDQKFKDLVHTLVVLLLALIILTAVMATTCTIFGYTMLSKQIADKR